MIDAFKSTLEELVHADIIIIVIDVNDTLLELKKKFASCMRTLSELGVEKDRMIFALNKEDLLEHGEIDKKVDMLGLTETKKWISVSAKTGNNIKDLKKLIKDIIENENSYKSRKEVFGVQKNW
jgi:GTP-binding protein HflX